MTDVLAHRGPDDAGLLVDPPAVLGHRRLSILDLSEAGHQPMRSRSGRYWITFNGEIFNYKELAQELRAAGHRFETTCDTEVLLAAYEQWGRDCLRRLNGMFAFALWDRAARELVCVRDRFGVKPLYYTVVGERFRFASEIKALLLDPAVERRPNAERVLDFLAYGFTDHTAETLFAGILQVPAGAVLVVRPGAPPPAPERWYHAAAAGPDRRAAAELRERLTDAVAIRLRSDVPVGTTLSGGLDSSAVTVLATALRAEQGLPPAPTFSSRCDDPRLDEGLFMERVLERTGAPNHAFTPGDAGLVGDLDRLLWHMDEPFHSAAVFGHRQLSQLVRATGVTVLLDGQGGDEALAGYDYLLYPGFFFTTVTRGRLGLAVAEARGRRDVQGVALRYSVRELLKVLLPNRVRAATPPAWLAAGASPSPPPLPGRSLLAHHLFGLEVQPLPMYNHQLDRNTMAVSLEARNPFLDYRVVECGLGLAPREHVRNGFTKWTLREALHDVLPPEILHRRRKQGFTTDESAWMRTGELSDAMEETFGSERFASRPFFDAAQLRALHERHRRGEEHHVDLWRAFVTERWLELFVDAPRVATPEGPEYERARARRAGEAVRRLEPLGGASR